jgi:Rrf2 family protein
MSIELIGIMAVGGQAPPQDQVLDMLSQKAKYALRALLALAKAPRGETVLISEIAATHQIPRKFLEQILLDLKNHGLVQSWRGRSGGYALLRAASDISFGQVLRIIDGPLAPLPCVSDLAYRKCIDCQDEASCVLRRVFAMSHRATVAVLDGISIAAALEGDMALADRSARMAPPASPPQPLLAPTNRAGAG